MNIKYYNTKIQKYKITKLQNYTDEKLKIYVKYIKILYNHFIILK